MPQDEWDSPIKLCSAVCNSVILIDFFRTSRPNFPRIKCKINFLVKSVCIVYFLNPPSFRAISNWKSRKSKNHAVPGLKSLKAAGTPESRAVRILDCLLALTDVTRMIWLSGQPCLAFVLNIGKLACQYICGTFACTFKRCLSVSRHVPLKWTALFRSLC